MCGIVIFRDYYAIAYGMRIVGSRNPESIVGEEVRLEHQPDSEPGVESVVVKKILSISVVILGEKIDIGLLTDFP